MLDDLDQQLEQSRALNCSISFPDPNSFKQITVASGHWIHCWELVPVLISMSPMMATSSWLSPAELLKNVMCTAKTKQNKKTLHSSSNLWTHSETRQEDPSSPKAHQKWAYSHTVISSSKLVFYLHLCKNKHISPPLIIFNRLKSNFIFCWMHRCDLTRAQFHSI